MSVRLYICLFSVFLPLIFLPVIVYFYLPTLDVCVRALFFLFNLFVYSNLKTEKSRIISLCLSYYMSVFLSVCFSNRCSHLVYPR